MLKINEIVQVQDAFIKWKSYTASIIWIIEWKEPKYVLSISFLFPWKELFLEKDLTPITNK